MAAAPPASRRVVFVTSKYWKATSKVGFHFLAQSFARAGWDVLFINTHASGHARHLTRDETSRVVRGSIGTRCATIGSREPNL